MGNELHIVSFDIPVPTNYGGAIDVFYKLKALAGEGICIHLHCFQYGREPSPLLEQICEKVSYYSRDIAKTKLFNRRPYIVATRTSPELLKNLLADDHPVLLEGIHSCYYLEKPQLRRRRVVVRTHNIEHDYYNSLAKVERNIFKRYYFFNEASKLERYEQVLHKAFGIAAISRNDQEYFSAKYRNVQTVSAFHPQEEVDILPGRGAFALYHASLDVGENNEAAIFLTGQVFNDLGLPLVIAGNKPSRELQEVVAQHDNVELRVGLTSEDITALVRQAHVNILPTFQATGIKLKLLLALHAGRFCIVNTPMVCHTGLEDLCIIRDSAAEMKSALKECFLRDFPEEEIGKRRKVLLENGFSNRYNARKLIAMLFGGQD